MPKIIARGRLRFGSLISPATHEIRFQPSNVQNSATKAMPSAESGGHVGAGCADDVKCDHEPWPKIRPNETIRLREVKVSMPVRFCKIAASLTPLMFTNVSNTMHTIATTDP